MVEKKLEEHNLGRFLRPLTVELGWSDMDRWSGIRTEDLKSIGIRGFWLEQWRKLIRTLKKGKGSVTRAKKLFAGEFVQYRYKGRWAKGRVVTSSDGDPKAPPRTSPRASAPPMPVLPPPPSQAPGYSGPVPGDGW